MNGQEVDFATRAIHAGQDPDPATGATIVPIYATSTYTQAAIAGVAHKHGAKLIVDNTFASPYLQQPLKLGADVVVHSTTKYLGGHSDVVGGAVVGPKDLLEPVKFYQNAAGGVPGPFDCYLTLRGLKTLAIRMDKHANNAAE